MYLVFNLVVVTQQCCAMSISRLARAILAATRTLPLPMTADLGWLLQA